ncbi:hypothetical protein [Streptomyces sp. Je 1-332]|uniref:hypothetical protein n=1 Tax=Streptomyces sp. Je 1-332 TaxID=3231270 RepID=UPI0034585AFA
MRRITAGARRAPTTPDRVCGRLERANAPGRFANKASEEFEKLDQKLHDELKKNSGAEK